MVRLQHSRAIVASPVAFDWQLWAAPAADETGLSAFLNRISFAHGLATTALAVNVSLAVALSTIQGSAGLWLSHLFVPCYALAFFMARKLRERLQSQPWGSQAILGVRSVAALGLLAIAVNIAVALAATALQGLMIVFALVVFVALLGGPAAGFVAGRIGGRIIANAFGWLRQLLFGAAAAEEEVASDTHGSARFADERDLEKGGLLADEGAILGAYHDYLVCTGLDGNVVTIAESDDGKAVGTVIPNLLKHLGSAVVLDPDGSTFAATAAARRAAGQRLLCLNPFACGTGEPGSLNPLDLLDPRAADFADDVQALSELIVVGPENAALDKARTVVRTLLAYVVSCYEPRERTLRSVRDLIFNDESALAEHLQRMRSAENHKGLLVAGANELGSWNAPERAQIMAVVQRSALFLESELVARSLVTTSIDLGSLRRGELTVYLQLPGERADSYGVVLRLWVHSLAMAVARSKEVQARAVLFMLDDVALLGPMHTLPRLFRRAKANGVAVWLTFANLTQLETLYPSHWSGLLSNAKAVQFFGVSEKKTADYISELAGDTTRHARTHAVSESWGESTTVGFGSFGMSGDVNASGSSSFFGVADSSAVSHGYAETEVRRRLITADEIRGLPKQYGVVFAQGVPPVPVRLISYLDSPIFGVLDDASRRS